ncbi:TetR/AcrR family transcriptional regulator [uncultured Clostridium sp.]|uniref:TetR/AcrR family transcriptional regulator n=1 Tax=uncultured Clostridium sp. TaxID=59620 RepID=UPI0025EE0882|nr:TetR/AcrR family transcriptional regulator [uncultured Clostridium sp.]
MNDQFYDLPEEKQLRIINAALEVFSRNDYKHAVTDEIARKAGISKGLLFYYFHNKKSLYLFLFEYCSKLVTSQVLDEQFGKLTDFFELLEYAAQEKLKILKQTPFVLEFVTRCFYLEKEPVIEELNRSICNFIGEAYGIFFEKIDRSRFREGIDPVEICNMITWMVDGYIHDRQRAGLPLDIEEMMENFYRWERRFREIAYKEEYQGQNCRQ